MEYFLLVNSMNSAISTGALMKVKLRKGELCTRLIISISKTYGFATFLVDIDSLEFVKGVQLIYQKLLDFAKQGMLFTPISVKRGIFKHGYPLR